jgi:pimeloyl-ACP methyl ester carboxylesterase
MNIEANGIAYYYEIHGAGTPLLLLHGGLGSIEMFGPRLAELAAKHQVIAVDLLGHGRTALGTREIDLADIANDMDILLDKLGIPKADVFGYSMGAGVALRLAVQHPARVNRLVLLSCGFAQDGFYPEMLAMQAQLGSAALEMMKPTPMYQSYVKVAPHPEDFGRLLDAMGAWMRRPYNWSEDVKKVRATTLLVVGDSDMFRLEHVIEFYKLLGGGQRDAGWMREHIAKNRLAIIPDATHYDILESPLLLPTVERFLSR